MRTWRRSSPSCAAWRKTQYARCGFETTPLRHRPPAQLFNAMFLAVWLGGCNLVDTAVLALHPGSGCSVWSSWGHVDWNFSLPSTYLGVTFNWSRLSQEKLAVRPSPRITGTLCGACFCCVGGGGRGRVTIPCRMLRRKFPVSHWQDCANRWPTHKMSLFGETTFTRGPSL